ncbi:hypothetical protein [Caballeronia zhejiangensis]|uniref:hypothetical protein n=1 Tax=Caballeronia zhejiangensis TaxID=871203 RepID=UPI001F518648|nr:hypothetical protein [Caballeronia zhejiangensis]
MAQENPFQEATHHMEATVQLLCTRLPPPQMKFVNGVAMGYRYSDQGALQAIIQKMARVVSALRAAQLLLSGGFIQEQAAINRMLDEAEDDINFLSLGIVFGETELHKQFLTYFFIEEYGDPNRPIQTRNKRGSIPRSKIHAYLHQNPAMSSDPSTGSAVMQTIHKAYSGYIHGASPHIMEMFGGTRPSFQMSGMRNTPLWEDHVDDLWNYVYRGILSFGMAAKAFGDDDLCLRMLAYSREFERCEPK